MEKYVLTLQLLCVLLCILPAIRGHCVCEDNKLCQPLTTPLPENEIFAFSGGDTAYWRQYDWTRVTTICKFGEIDPQMVCYAHSRGVRITFGAAMDVNNSTNPQLRKQWIQTQIKYLQDNYLDGINVDMEAVITQDQVQLRDGMAALMEETYAAVKAINPQMQVTFDAPAYPGPPTEGMFPHYYDFVRMSKAVDFYFVMFYDMTGPNVSWANSPLNSTLWALDLFLMEGIPVSKLLLGVAWYGWNYPCAQLQGNRCEVDRTSRGKQMNYKTIIEECLPLSPSGRQYNNTAESPYFNYRNASTGKMHQIWYDDPQSLKLRSDYAMKLQLRGVGMWTADGLDYSNTTQGKQMVTEMWNSLPSYQRQEEEQQQQSTGFWPEIQWLVTFIVSCFSNVPI